MADYGDVVLKRHDDGRIEVIEAPDLVGVSVELLAQADLTGMWVASDGTLCLAGQAWYRPVRFDGMAGRPSVLVCERVSP